MTNVIYTKEFNSCLRNLKLSGKSREVQKVQSAVAEAGMNGEISSLPRTNHGENRLPNVEKFRLSDGDRLVVQLIDGKGKVRAFLFAGTHDETERWLNAHKNHRWIHNDSDGTLTFTQVTELVNESDVPHFRLDLESPKEFLSYPLLRTISENDWADINITQRTLDYILGITGNMWEEDAYAILGKLFGLEDENKATLIFDLLQMAHEKRWKEITPRIEQFIGLSSVVTGRDITQAALNIVNSDSIITFSDEESISDFVASTGSFTEWMYFLHPSQRLLVERNFKGPARLRGISGSGKTCVLLHRARRLAKEYKSDVMILTLTESMRKLLEGLLHDLCGEEIANLKTATVSSFIRQAIGWYQKDGLHDMRMAASEELEQIVSLAINEIMKQDTFGISTLNRLSSDELMRFIREEISFIRGRALKHGYSNYLNTTTFPRHGRKLALDVTARRICLHALNYYESELEKQMLLDYESYSQYAREFQLTLPCRQQPYRSILVDEVQDLTQLDLEVIANLPVSQSQTIANIDNGLFLVGDGTQTIYKRGFSLRSIGIQITGRSSYLKKNYRNSFEILQAAFALVKAYKFADVDEDNFSSPEEPDFPLSHGVRPRIIKCNHTRDEADFICEKIKSLLNAGQTPGQICIIGCNKTVRKDVQCSLEASELEYIELKQDANPDGKHIKLSTIESAKGHEFSVVFIAGLVDGVIPLKGCSENEIAREAARLYVGMTRARDELFLSYSPRPGSPVSRFLSQIIDYCDEM